MPQDLTHGDPCQRGSLNHCDDQVGGFGLQSLSHFVDLRLLPDIKVNPQLAHSNDGLRPGGRVAAYVEYPIELIQVGSTSKYLLSLIKFQDKGTKGKDIRFGIIGQVQDNFQGTVPSRDHVLSVLSIGVELSGEPKVNELDFKSGGVDKDILRFDIPMHNATEVHVGQSLAHLPYNISDIVMG